MAPISASRHLNFPTSVTADPDGRIYIAESGLPIGGAPAEYVGHLIVALFGDECSLTGPVRSRVGRKLVRVALADRSVHPVKPLPFQRPIDVYVRAQIAGSLRGGLRRIRDRSRQEHRLPRRYRSVVETASRFHGCCVIVMLTS